jgi:sulfatase-modifying factor enzyme 1
VDVTSRERRPQFVAWRARSATTRGAVVLLLAGLWCGGRVLADGEAPERVEIERLRREMELSWLDVQRDHRTVRAATWADVVLDQEFAALLDAAVAEVRARPASAEPHADAQQVADFLAALSARHVDAPLTRTSLLVVLGETFRRAASDESAARDLFVAAAKAVFEKEKVEDVWDERFRALPAVIRFAALHARLAAAAAVKESQNEADRPAGRDEALDAQVFLDRARPWLGPWTGWISDVPEKLNKRQQRPVKPVWMDRYETTCRQYAAWLASLPAPQRRAMLPVGWSLDEKDTAQPPAGKERHPVTGVSWRQALGFAEAAGKRLPTCDEWERAAAGVEKEPRLFPWGNAEDGRNWAHLGVEPKGTFPVDAFADDETPEGIVGMAGNVAEIVATWSDRTDLVRPERTEKSERARQVIVCGGSYTSHVSECATSWRWVLDDDGTSPSVGFRCVMDEAEYKKRHPGPR